MLPSLAVQSTPGITIELEEDIGEEVRRCMHRSDAECQLEVGHMILLALGCLVRPHDGVVGYLAEPLFGSDHGLRRLAAMGSMIPLACLLGVRHSACKSQKSAHVSTTLFYIS